MKGLFIPGITAKMFKDASLESVAALMAEGKIYDIDYQEPCQDAISREDLKERKFIIAKSDYQKGWNDALDAVYENASSIQPKTGHWIVVDDCGDNLICECSECKDEVWFKDASRMWNYCSSCGARMKGVEE